MRNDYFRKMNKVIEYINNHIDEKMNLQTLADVSGFSTFHFHRLFKASQKETLASYISRVRVETSARFLRFSSLSIETIAYNIGYESPSSLSKAFKQWYGISPRAYRKNKNISIMKKEIEEVVLQLEDPKIEDLAAKPIIYIRLIGAFESVDYDGASDSLWRFIKEKGLPTDDVEHIAIYHDDPCVTESSKLRSDMCLTVNQEVSPEGEIGVKEIAKGKYACFLYQGPYCNLGAAYDYIFEDWLPRSGYEIRNVPIFQRFVNDAATTEPEKVLTEIYVPITR